MNWFSMAGEIVISGSSLNIWPRDLVYNTNRIILMEYRCSLRKVAEYSARIINVHSCIGIPIVTFINRM